MDIFEKSFRVILVEEKNFRQNYYIPGIWALFGQRKDNINDKKIYCLQVASTNNIGKEILSDFELLNSEYNPKFRTKYYINQLGEEVFKYKDYPSCREQLYSKEIREKFYNFKFVLKKRDKKEVL